MNDAGSDAGECECGEFERNTGTDAGKHAGKLQVWEVQEEINEEQKVSYVSWKPGVWSFSEVY